jgi:hypothetical protein
MKTYELLSIRYIDVAWPVTFAGIWRGIFGI